MYKPFKKFMQKLFSKKFILAVIWCEKVITKVISFSNKI